MSDWDDFDHMQMIKVADPTIMEAGSIAGHNRDIPLNAVETDSGSGVELAATGREAS